MCRRSLVYVVPLLLLVPALAMAQGLPTGTLTGVVTHEGAPLPGATITVSSPNLQGSRVEVTRDTGEFIFPFLPAGDYTVTVQMEGFQSQERNIRVSAAQSSRLSVPLSLAALSEAIVVTADQDTISESVETAVTYRQEELIEKLAVARNLTSVVSLAPGVTQTGPGKSATNANGNLIISGAQSYENLFLLNGVVINENLRGQPLDLFIEDAIQETTVQTAGISAEYGRFGGGVVNALTKSGGNEFEGSFRTNLDNDDWEEKTPVTTADPVDELNKTFEATLGGRILRDQLWFFLAGRSVEQTKSLQTGYTGIPYTQQISQDRYEGKLTWALTPNHSLVGSYMEIEQQSTNSSFQTVMDTRSLYDRSDPQELLSVNYSGVLSSNLFLEGQYSERNFIISQGGGARSRDLIEGTLLLDQTKANARFWSPTFCAVCGPPESRNNENLLAKATYFLTTPSLGSHEVAVGFDRFDDMRQADNYQSGSDYRIYVTATHLDGTEIYPVLRPLSTYFYWTPIFESSQGNRMRTDSIFVNDRIRYNDRLSLSVGLRYDRNDAVNQAGLQVADDDRISPRLGFTYDIGGDGRTQLQGSFGRYVTAITNGVGDSGTTAGQSVYFGYDYTGPAINTDPANLIPTPQVLAMFFDWLAAQGGVDALVPGVVAGGSQTQILESLDSPYVDEISVGVTKNIGTRGVIRADYVNREFGSFYVSRIDMTTGRATLPGGRQADRALIENDDSVLERSYDGVQLQSQYRLFDSLSIGGNYTWSQTRGNFIGEFSNSGPVATDELEYPEYKEAHWNNPYGYLGSDQRHNGRLWVVWDALDLARHDLSVSLLQSYASGTPYGASAQINPAPYVTNPGYLAPSTLELYWFTGRDAFRTDDISRTDLAVNYALKLDVAGRGAEIFVQPEMLNVFNEQGAEVVNTTVFTSRTRAGLQAFDPFKETPVEGVHWQKGSSFGQPTLDWHYQQPRLYRVSVGVRF